MTELPWNRPGESVEPCPNRRISRRQLLRRVALAATSAGVVWIAGCAPAPVPTATPAPPPTAPPPAKPTAAPPTPPPAAKPTTAAAPAGSPAPAAQPTRSPITVRPDDPAIEAGMVDFRGEVGPIFAYLARPKGTGPFPGVIVIHENRGLVEHIKDVARRLAKEGYAALAVDLVSREGGTARFSDDQQVINLLSGGGLKPDDLGKDLNTSFDYLSKQPFVKADRIGVVGFCFGGGMTLRMSTANPNLKAAVSFYGPNPPLEAVPNIRAQLHLIYASEDPRITVNAAQFEEALKKAGKPYEAKVYQGVRHAFHNDTGAAYNEAAAKEAWAQTLTFFTKHLKG